MNSLYYKIVNFSTKTRKTPEEQAFQRRSPRVFIPYFVAHYSVKPIILLSDAPS